MTKKQLPPNMQTIMESTEVKQLIQMLKTQNSDALKNASTLAEAGSMELAMKQLRPVLEKQEIQNILQEIKKKHG